MALPRTIPVSANRGFVYLLVAWSTLAVGGCSSSGPDTAEAPPIDVRPPDPSQCVLPTPESVRDGSYPLARPLFIYVNKKNLQEKPQLYLFVRYYIEHAGKLAQEIGYFPFQDDVTAENLKTLSEIVPEPPTGPAKGDVHSDGSSTVYPVTQAVAEEFMKEHPDIRVLVAVSGTGGGFKKFVRGETDINCASRPITESERQLCEQNGVEYVTFKVCIDAIVVAVNPENDWCDCLSFDQLREIWKPGSVVKYWSQINPNWPQEPIRLYGADADSGTFDYFTEAVVGKARSSRADYTPSADDNVLVRGIAGDRYALGYIPYAYYAENKSSLKAVRLARTDGGAE